jgi:hypothetical protein
VTAVSYDDLVAAATVGLSHSPLPVTTLAGAAAGHEAVLAKDDQAAALLDAAALMTAARRAGVLPAAGVAVPPAAATDAAAAAELPAGAARLIRRLGSPQLLADLLTEAASRGYRAPAPLLPFLLDLAARDKALRRAVAGVLGTRGHWLAQYRPDWQQVADAGPPDQPAADAGAAGDPAGPGVWETGSHTRRRAYLAGLRDRDPAAARELLAASWAQETGPEREALLALLADGLSADDEAFLEQAGDDRKESVRNVALGLLASLPDSAYQRRAAQRAAPLLRLEQGGTRRRLIASPPERADAAATRDGISPTPPEPSTSVPAWLLIQTIAAAPLSGWVTAFGMDPGQIVSLGLAPDGQQVVVHAGWRFAAIRQANAEWAQALLAAAEPAEVRKRPPAVWPRDCDLAAVLPAGARAARAAALLAEPDAGSDPAAEVAGCARPWPEPLADAVVAALGRALASAARPGYSAATHGLTVVLSNAAGHGVPVTSRTDYAAALAQLASADNCPQYWTTLLRKAADTAAVRRAFLEEIH